MSDPSTSANGLTLDITSDDPCIAYSREAYAEVCRLRAENAEKETMLLNQATTIKEMQAENESLREALKPFADMCGLIERCVADYPADHPASNPEKWPDLLRARSAYEGEK